MKNSTAVLTLQKRYQRLQEELAQVGLIALGTITPRLIIKSDPEDKTKRKTYGPYYQWTYKQQGKTVTVNLTRSQTREFQKAISNQRKLERIVAKMLALSKTILQSTTEGVAKRMRSARTQTP
jgi:uncharacterized iron-regulated protein